MPSLQFRPLASSQEGILSGRFFFGEFHPSGKGSVQRCEHQEDGGHRAHLTSICHSGLGGVQGQGSRMGPPRRHPVITPAGLWLHGTHAQAHHKPQIGHLGRLKQAVQQDSHSSEPNVKHQGQQPFEIEGNMR